MSRGRRIKPSTVEGRRRKAELGKIIANTRTSKAEREAALRELEALAPLASGQDLQDWNQRIETAKENGSQSPVKAESGGILSRGTPDSNRLAQEQALAQLALEDQARFIRKAENTTPQQRAEVLVAELPDHPLQKLARERAEWLWREDLSNPKPDTDRMVHWTVSGWLARQPYNRHDVRGNTETVANAVNDVYRLLAERDTADPGWFVRRAEKLFDSPVLPPVKTERAPEPEPLKPAVSTDIRPVSEESEPARSPISQAGVGLPARAAPILATDGWLTNLAEHSPEMRARIVAGLSDELLRTGVVRGDFAAKLYNELRPRAVGKYPPRNL
jgi:hypothetical protein